MAKLKRTLGFAECVFFGVGSILGAGIYTLIGKVAGWSGNITWLTFIIASLTAVLTALSYAELSAAFPKAGGEFIYAKKAFGKRAGIFIGTLISLNAIISGATVSLGFAGYLTGLIGLNTVLAALGIILLLFLVNISGIRQSSTINIIFTLIEAGGLLFVIVSAIPYIGKVNYLELPPEGMTGILTASALAFFAYIGFEDIVKLAEETKDPQKNIPRALMYASAIVFVFYILIAICSVSVVPSNDLASSGSPLSDIVGVTVGNSGLITISIIALFATSNTILSNMLSSSRVLLEMSAETKILKMFSKISKRQTPVTALILILMIMISLSLIGDIEIIARIATFFVFVTFIMVNVIVIALRINQKSLVRPYRIPWCINNIPVSSVAAILMTLILLGYNVYSLVS